MKILNFILRLFLLIFGRKRPAEQIDEMEQAADLLELISSSQNAAPVEFEQVEESDKVILKVPPKLAEQDSEFVGNPNWEAEQKRFFERKAKKAIAKERQRKLIAHQSKMKRIRKRRKVTNRIQKRSRRQNRKNK